MRVYASPHQRPNTETVLAIGSFDGVHLGHQALMTALLERSRFYSVPAVVVTFDPPTRVLFQGVKYLCTLPEKVAVLERYKVDEVIAIPFDLMYARRPKDAFLEDLKVMRPRAIVVGDDTGALHGINEGTVAAHARGILTDTNVIVPGPWENQCASAATRIAGRSAAGPCDCRWEGRTPSGPSDP